MPTLNINKDITLLGEGSFGINVETQCSDKPNRPQSNFLQITSKNCNPNAGENKFVLKLCKNHSKCLQDKNEEILGKSLVNNKTKPVTGIHKNLLYIIEEITLSEDVRKSLVNILLKKKRKVDESNFSTKALLMPYYNSGSLSEYIQETDGSPKHNVDLEHTIIDDMFYAVRFLQSFNWAHLDIKPDNIMLHCLGQNNYKAVLIDYGFAQSVKEKINLGSGTAPYMSPELSKCHYIIAGVEPVLYSKGPDIWALGLVILETYLKNFNPWMHRFIYMMQPKIKIDFLNKHPDWHADPIWYIRHYVSENVYKDDYCKKYYIEAMEKKGETTITIAKNKMHIKRFLDIFFEINEDNRIRLFDELVDELVSNNPYIKDTKIDKTLENRISVADKLSREAAQKRMADIAELRAAADAEAAAAAADARARAEATMEPYALTRHQQAAQLRAVLEQGPDAIDAFLNSTPSSPPPPPPLTPEEEWEKLRQEAPDVSSATKEGREMVAAANLEAMREVKISDYFSAARGLLPAEKWERLLEKAREGKAPAAPVDLAAAARARAAAAPPGPSPTRAQQLFGRLSRLVTRRSGGKTKRKRQIKRKFIQKTKGKKKKLSKKNRKPKNRKTQQKK